MSQHTEFDSEFISSVRGHIRVLYPAHSAGSLLDDATVVFDGFTPLCAPPQSELWSARDCLLIT